MPNGYAANRAGHSPGVECARFEVITQLFRDRELKKTAPGTNAGAGFSASSLQASAL